MFKVGDIVYSVTYGRGTVVDLETGDYGVEVEFDEGDYSVNYTSDGREYDDCNQDLFFEPIPIPQSALERPRWRALHGEKYFYVRSTGEVGMRVYRLEFEENIEDKLFEVGNYFQSEEEAKASKFYKVFNREDI